MKFLPFVILASCLAVPCQAFADTPQQIESNLYAFGVCHRLAELFLPKNVSAPSDLKAGLAFYAVDVGVPLSYAGRGYLAGVESVNTMGLDGAKVLNEMLSTKEKCGELLIFSRNSLNNS